MNKMEKKDFTEEYCKSIGFKVGLEVHQQLETHKLFCNCPSLVNDPNKTDVRFERKFRAVLSESGDADVVSQYEIRKNKKVIYEACSTSSCLVEYDEEPPH